MCDGDAMKYPYYEDMDTIPFLNLLTYRIEKAAEQERINQIERIKNKVG